MNRDSQQQSLDVTDNHEFTDLYQNLKHEPEASWQCCEKKISKQALIENIAQIFILGSTAVYFIILCIDFWNPEVNRKDFSTQIEVATMPTPFIYLDWDTVKHPANYSCEYTIYIANTTIYDSHSDTSDIGATLINISTNVNDPNGKISIDSLLTSKEWHVVFQKTQTYDQILVLPPYHSELPVNTKNDNGDIVFFTYCGFENTSLLAVNQTNQSRFDALLDAHKEIVSDIIYETLIWYDIDHIDGISTANYGTVLNTLNSLHFQTDFILGGYVVSMQYEWFRFNNQVDKHLTLPDYYVATVGSTFDIINFESVLSMQLANRGYVDMLQLLVAPDDSGSQITYNTVASHNWTDVFAWVGGMYETVFSVINCLAIYLLWGSGKCRGKLLIAIDCWLSVVCVFVFKFFVFFFFDNTRCNE